MKKIISKISIPLRYFINDSRSAGLVLLLSTIVSLIIANSSVGYGYRNFWHSSVSIYSLHCFPSSVVDWINNCLMSVFFLMAGIEIKRELSGEGELSSFKKAIMPVGAAIGGMIIPALLFAIFNKNTEHAQGWGVPMATDIAFSLGVASLLGKRVPYSLKIFLLALAIIDDLGAIVVIALFYSSAINVIYIVFAFLVLLALMIVGKMKKKFGVFHVLLALLLWFCMFNSGVEGSIAGVLVALALPKNALSFVETNIHKWVNFAIVPLFALANTAILINTGSFPGLLSTVSIGIIVGLVVGKPLGIFISTRLLYYFKIGHLPTNIEWKHIVGVGILASIGFTMSIFISLLAFNNEITITIAKQAILAAVLLSSLISVFYFRLVFKAQNK